MAKQQAEPMWVARNDDLPHYGAAYVIMCHDGLKMPDGAWQYGSSIDPAQSPVELEPGGGPVKVRLVEA